jgi:hypothetical protein
MRYRFACAGALMATILFAMPAAADQASAPTQTTLKLGAFYPSTVGMSAPLIVGLDVGVGSHNPNAFQDLSVYVDAIGLGSPANFSAGLGLALRSRGSVYGGGGLGIYYTSGIYNVAFARLPGPSSSNASAAGFGGKVFAGVEFAKMMQLEADYHVTPPAGSTSLTGLGLELGIRI